MPLLAHTVFDLLDRMAAVTTVAGVWQTYMAEARRVGLTFGIAAFLPGNKSIATTTFGNAFPEGWLEHYAAQDYQQCDPLMQRNFKSFTPFTWSMHDYDGVLPHKQHQWRADNMATGVEAGFTIPDRSDGDLKIITLCGEAHAIDPLDLKLLHFAGLEALVRMHELGLHADRPHYPALSQRERECLQWVAAGKSDWEIGQILSLSEKTVNIYIERAKAKYNVTSRAQAVVLALRIGAIAA